MNALVDRGKVQRRFRPPRDRNGRSLFSGCALQRGQWLPTPNSTSSESDERAEGRPHPLRRAIHSLPNESVVVDLGGPTLAGKLSNCRLHNENPCLSALALCRQVRTLQTSRPVGDRFSSIRSQIILALCGRQRSWRMFFRSRPNSPTLRLVRAFSVRNRAICTSYLKPSAVPSFAGVPVALGKPKGILGEPIEYIKHSCHARSTDCTHRDRLNHFSTSATMHTCVKVTGNRLSLVV